MTQIRWGIIGAGRIAHTFAQDMPATGNGIVQSVAARSGDSARAFAGQYGIATAHAGYEALYANPDVDAIYIATPHTLHLQHASDALRAGKAVMCEKPITVNAEECQQLIQVAEETESYLMEAMWTWFLPAVRKAKQWVDEGRIGRIVQIQSDFGYPQVYSPDKREYNAELAGGCLLEMGVYPVALTALFAGAGDPQQVSVVSRHAPNGVEDDVVATFNYSGFVATLGTSFRAKLRNWAYIVGEEGYVAIPNFWRATECQLWVLDDMVDRFDDGRSTYGFDYQTRAVNEDLAAGRTQSETIPLSASLKFQRHMDLIRSKS
ncbi:MAG: Gfo/Idh/MocA family oxidoreductase [Xanthomonadales bacterium]|nr:Gfo/Idh/MocA family oxidoreductase [Xanthomonadales bacterium]